MTGAAPGRYSDRLAVQKFKAELEGLTRDDTKSKFFKAVDNKMIDDGVVKRVPIKLTEQQMKELEVKWWFNDFVVKIVKKEKKKLEATQNEDESDSSSDEDVPLRARGRAAGVVVDVDSSSSVQTTTSGLDRGRLKAAAQCASLQATAVTRQPGATNSCGVGSARILVAGCPGHA